MKGLVVEKSKSRRVAARRVLVKHLMGRTLGGKSVIRHTIPT